MMATYRRVKSYGRKLNFAEKIRTFSKLNKRYIWLQNIHEHKENTEAGCTKMAEENMEGQSTPKRLINR